MHLINKEFPFVGTKTVPSCHASTVVKLTDGSFVSAWFAGEKEGSNDVSIWYALRQNGSWSAPEMICRAEELPHWNPVLFQQKDGTICLFYKIGPNCSDWKTMFTTSREGKNWSLPTELIAGDTSGGRGPVRNKPIYGSCGQILAPGSTEKGSWLPFVDVYREETGWKKTAIPTDPQVGMIQPTLWEWEPGRFSALMRSNHGKIYRSDSMDGGESWSMAYATDMPNNNSGIDCVRLQDGTLVLVCNPVEQNWGARSPLSVFTSRDNGVTFRRELDLETEKAEFSYPAVITDGDRIFVTYTYRRERITFCELSLC